MTMRCVDSLAATILEPVSPDPLDLWEKSRATISREQIDNEHEALVARYEPHVSKIKTFEQLGDWIEIVKNNEVVGYRSTYRVEMTTGIRHDVSVYLPTESQMEQAQVTIHMDTPWMTGIEGHNDETAESFMTGTNQPVVLVGPEIIEKHTSGLYVVKNLGSVATESSQVSLSLAAQDSMEIAAELAESLDLPRLFVQVGESRAGMLAPAKHAHTERLDVQNVYYDLTDPSVPHNLRDDPAGNLVRLAKFGPNEGLRIMPVALDRIRRRSVLRLLGTIPCQAEYMTASLLGTSRAIGSGEAGLLPAQLPEGTAVHVANFQHNPLAFHESWRELYGHTAFGGVNLRGAHLGLAYGSVRSHVVERINRYLYELYICGNEPTRIDLRRVHLTDDKKYLDAREHMPSVA